MSAESVSWAVGWPHSVLAGVEGGAEEPDHTLHRTEELGGEEETRGTGRRGGEAVWAAKMFMEMEGRKKRARGVTKGQAQRKDSHLQVISLRRQKR